MENPATWGEAERIVDKALEGWEMSKITELQPGDEECGLSIVRQITDALRLKGLLREHETTAQRLERQRLLSHDWDAQSPARCSGLAYQDEKCRLNAGHPGPCMSPSVPMSRLCYASGVAGLCQLRRNHPGEHVFR